MCKSCVSKDPLLLQCLPWAGNQAKSAPPPKGPTTCFLQPSSFYQNSFWGTSELPTRLSVEQGRATHRNSGFPPLQKPGPMSLTSRWWLSHSHIDGWNPILVFGLCPVAPPQGRKAYNLWYSTVGHSSEDPKTSSGHRNKQTSPAGLIFMSMAQLNSRESWCLTQRV